jgi:hypothetical protein
MANDQSKIQNLKSKIETPLLRAGFCTDTHNSFQFGVIPRVSARLVDANLRSPNNANLSLRIKYRLLNFPGKV